MVRLGVVITVLRIIGLAIANLSLIALSGNQIAAQAGVRYDSLDLRSYSNKDLLSLLSESSIALNLGQRPDIVHVFPTRVLLEMQAEGRSSDSTTRGLFIRIDTVGTALAYLEAVVTELAGRKPYSELLRTFDSTSDAVQLRWVAEVLTRLRGAEADRGLRRVARSGPNDDEKTYLALTYFAEGGATWALQRLNCSYDVWPVSSLDRAQMSFLFGLHKYYPAGPNLAKALDAASLNLADAAMRSLLSLFPAGRRDFTSPEEAKAYWMRYLATRDGEGC